jgi:hypothetical protein
MPPEREDRVQGSQEPRLVLRTPVLVLGRSEEGSVFGEGEEEGMARHRIWVGGMGMADERREGWASR